MFIIIKMHLLTLKDTLPQKKSKINEINRYCYFKNNKIDKWNKIEIFHDETGRLY